MGRRHRGRSAAVKREMRERLAKRDGWRCRICGMALDSDTATIDHIRRLKDGGGWKLKNMRLTCEQCNKARERKNRGWNTNIDPPPTIKHICQESERDDA